jgi:hypothetical protein
MLDFMRALLKQRSLARTALEPNTLIFAIFANVATRSVRKIFAAVQANRQVNLFCAFGATLQHSLFNFPLLCSLLAYPFHSLFALSLSDKLVGFFSRVGFSAKVHI